MGAVHRSAATLLQPRLPFGAKASGPLVAGGPRDPVVLTQLSHRPVSALKVGDEAGSFLHGARLGPWHPGGVNDVPGQVLTMYLGRTRTLPNPPLQRTWSSLTPGTRPLNGKVVSQLVAKLRGPGRSSEPGAH